MSRRYTADPDRGAGRSHTSKQTEMLDRDEFAERKAIRDGARQLDQMIEMSPGLTRQQRDRDRAMPRAAVAPEGHPLKQRRLPDPTAVRRPLSQRQKDARSRDKYEAQARLRHTEYAELSKAISDRDYWTRLNDVLSDAVGQVDHLPDDLRMQIQRRDRAIQAYERANDRSHVVYTNVQLPPAVNRGNVDGFISRHFAADNEVDFDRFTAARHTMHELDGDTHRGFEPLFEIETRRGMYLGRSGRKDRTDHLLPRGMRLRVIGHHVATYRRPDGSTGQRRVIQLRDVTDDAVGGEAR